MNNKKIIRVEKRLDKVFLTAFFTNDKPMLDWALIKFELKRLRSIVDFADEISRKC